MSESGNNIKVGIFALIGIIVFMISVIVFSGSQNMFKSSYYLKAHFPSTQGLAAGSVVSLGGVEVGNVAKIDFDEKSELVATLKILEEFRSRITTDSLASIRTQGALGDKYIYIRPGLTSGTPLKDNEIVPSDKQPDFLEAIAQKATEVSLVDTVREINTLLTNLNADGNSGKLMENMVTASQNISNLMNEPSIRESFFHLRNVLRKIDKGDGTLGKLINDPSLYDRLMSILGETPRNTYLKPLLREAIKQNETEKR